MNRKKHRIMKKTLNVNIGSVAFTIDEDAYRTLSGYYGDIRSRLYESDRQEVMEDIEARTADIFRENLSSPGQVVDTDLVKRAIAILGSAQTFGERQYDPDYETVGEEPVPPKKLYRSRDNSVIGGVCGGIAEYFNIDSTLVRVATFLLVFFGGLSLWVYIILWIVLPLRPKDDYKKSYYERKDRRRV